MLAENIDLDRALVYMGSRGRDASALMPLVSECAEKLAQTAVPRYYYRLLPLCRTDAGIELSGTGLVLTGSSIAEHLEGCDRCIILAATLSEAADKLIRSYEAYDMAKAFVTDCIASSAIEDVCDEAEAEIRSRLPDKFFTWRYSPGYGDLPLSLQGKFLSVLEAPKRIGLNVTESCMLVPAKSVTAVIGVSDGPIERSKRGCLGCVAYENCSFRKGGYHCGS